jgi:hypothetical protein
MLCKITQWVSFSLHFSHFSLHIVGQTLTKLFIGGVKIGDKSAQHLANILRKNTVNLFLFSSFVFSSSFLPQVLTELDLWKNSIESEERAEHLANALRTNTVHLSHSSSLTFSLSLFHTDTHRFSPSCQSNRSQRSPTCG